jgi:hypothetical protein
MFNDAKNKTCYTSRTSICVAHSVQLAVYDTLYKHNEIHFDNSIVDAEPDISTFNCDLIEIDGKDGDYAEYYVVGFGISCDEDDSLFLKNQNIKGVIEKVRKLAVLFKRSPLKNDKLQEHVKMSGMNTKSR